MQLGNYFGRPRTLASVPKKRAEEPAAPTQSALAQTLNKKRPGQFGIKWAKPRVQGRKDYKPILTVSALEAYLRRCEETGHGSFDWETTASETTRAKFQQVVAKYTVDVEAAEGEAKIVKKLLAEFEEKRKEFLKTPLDPWKGEICTVSISAAVDEARVIPISHKEGKVFEPQLSREEARALVLDTLDRMLFRNPKIMKIAVNLPFETKFAAKYGKYILMPVADPFVMWVRCLQIAAPQRIQDPKKPAAGWGLKPATKTVFGVEMNDFSKLLAQHEVDFFDEIDASEGAGLLYSAEDSDYGLQHYLYWSEIAKQIPNYESWLHNIEMPFSRVIGLMEYHGMAWDTQLAETKRQEAEAAQIAATEEIKTIAKDLFDIEINTGKSGKTNDVKSLIFEYMKLPAAKWSKKTGAPSLDEEALIDMTFMLENNLVNLDEEKFLGVALPDGWENIDPDEAVGINKEMRSAIRISQREPHKYRDAGLRLLELLKRVQKYSTLLSSHIDGREMYLNDESGRIHAQYTPWTETARLNSSKPNGQNVPRLDNDALGVRNFYVPKPGKILFFIDVAGFELRLLAWRSGDEVMIYIFLNNGDMHRKTASTLTGKPESEVTKKERTDAKPGNFGIAYVGTGYALQTTFKTDYGVRKSLDECERIVDAVKRTYPGIPNYHANIAQQAREDGYVPTIYGFIRLLPDINHPSQGVRSGAERQAANTPIQGSAADIMKRSQNEIYDEIGRGDGVLQHDHTDMIAQIHDEIIFEMDDDPDVVEAAYLWIKTAMEKPPLPDFPVPIVAEASVGYRWGEKMDVEKWLTEKRSALSL